MADLIGDIEFFRGDGYPLELTIKSKETSIVIDLTGYSFLMTADKTQNPVDDATKMFEVAGVLDADPTTGKVSFTITSLNTDIDPDTDYFYDIQMTDATGNIRTIVKNKFKIKQDITK